LGSSRAPGIRTGYRSPHARLVNLQERLVADLLADLDTRLHSYL
jgi:hypothetical protein